MSILSMEKTTEQLIYENTALEIGTQILVDLTEKKTTESNGNYLLNKENTVVEINFTNAISELMQEYHHPNYSNPEAYWHDNILYAKDEMSHNTEVTKIGTYDMSINDAIEIALEAKKEKDYPFWGILVREKEGHVYNPFHPILMNRLIKENFDMDNKIYTLLCYSFMKNKISDEELVEQEKSIVEIASIISAVNNDKTYKTENNNAAINMEDGKFVIDYDETTTDIESGEVIEAFKSNGYIVPLQLTNINGLAYPYYGAVYMNNGVAWNITPMFSANVGRPTSGGDHGSSVCTNGGNQKTVSGISVLSRSNLGSPLNSNCWLKGWQEYGITSFNVAIELSGYEYVAEEGPIPTLTLSEYKEKYTNSTKTDYIAYIKEKLNNLIVEVEEPTRVQTNNGERQDVTVEQ